MIAVLYAALSGLSYGAADFSGALASKRDDATLVTLAMQIVSLLALAVVLAAFPDGTILASDLVWGAVGGLGAAVALVTFYQALAIGPMSTAASLTALVGATAPVAAGLALGEVPGTITLIGIGLAIPAGVLVSVGGFGLRGAPVRLPPRETVMSSAGAQRTRVLAVVAGFGFGVFFIALSRTSEDGGLYPLVGARLASIVALAVVINAQRLWAPISRPSWPAVAIAGVLDCAANSLYLLALDSGSFTWVAAISSLYPVSTVLLARLVLDERISRTQVLGLVGAGVALCFVAIGR